MKSIAIKTNNKVYTKYLLEKLKKFNTDNIYFSCKKFKIYKNIIIHYMGQDNLQFLNEISRILSKLVIENTEEYFLKKILQHEYFYFDTLEKNDIFNLAIEDGEEADYENSFEALYDDFFEYLLENKSLILDGFIPFRIKEYLSILEERIDIAVNKYLIESEYSEFVSLLKMYISVEPSKTKLIHLIYYNSNSTLLDYNKNVIPLDSNMLNAKYLSDISFSSNDLALNALLTLLPQKIYVHLIDENQDEFISTLKLIFENRLVICTECSICNIYKKIVR